jgi:DNA invertase Pin-like site-specific DNA recombinase
MAYAIYARKSEESEERQVQSIDDQIRLDRRRADELGLLVGEEITESRSAKEPGREGFARLMELIDKEKIDGIIAWHPDRLSRNELDAAAITYRIRHGKLKDLRFVNYFFDNSPEGIMMLQMALSQSQYFSSKLSKDVGRGLTSKMEKGWFPHRVPEGYLNDLLTRTNLPDPERFATIRRFWDLVLSGWSVSRALRTLNEEWGYRTRPSSKRGDGPLSKAAAYRLLGNVFYTGYFLVKGVTYKGNHAPMITPEEFNQVQEFIQRDLRPRYRKHDFLFTGLIRCANCGCQVTASISQGKAKKRTWTYYHCANGKRICTKRGMEERELESQINALLQRITISQEVEEYIISIVSKWHNQQSGLQQDIYEDQMKALAEAQRQITALLNLKLREMIDDADFSEKHKELKDEIARLKKEVDNTEHEFNRVRQSALNTVRFLAHAHERFLVGSIDDKREIARALGIAYLFDGENLQIELPCVSIIGETSLWRA